MEMIEVDRSNPDAAAASIDRAVGEIRKGKSIILFPEGTRSREKFILPFKKGAFVLAIKANAPIVPVTLIGTDKVLKPGGILLYPGNVQVLIHDPISTDGLNLEDRDELLEKARRPILATFPSQ